MQLEFYIRHYGKSFYWAGKFLKKDVFADCAILYAFCRVADDLVDENKNSKTKIDKFIKEYSNTKSKNIIINKFKKIQEKYTVEGIGIGMPGMLSLNRHVLMEAANLPTLNGTNIYQPLKDAFPNLVISLENDANCAALGELYFGGHNLDNFTLMTLGTGVGGGVIIHRKLFIGAKGNAGEIGKIFAEWNKGELSSFLIEITADILQQKDPMGPGFLVDKILDTAGQKDPRSDLERQWSQRPPEPAPAAYTAL